MEAMKKECHGIASSFSFPFVFKFAFLLTCLLLFGLALRVEKQKLSEGIKEMKTLVHTSHNKAEEVITQAKEELALAKLIRRGADRDLGRPKKLLKTCLASWRWLLKTGKFLWKSFRSVADVLRTPADDGQSWA